MKMEIPDASTDPTQPRWGGKPEWEGKDTRMQTKAGIKSGSDQGPQSLMAKGKFGDGEERRRGMPCYLKISATSGPFYTRAP